MVLTSVLIAVIVIAVLAVVGLAVGLGVGFGLPLANKPTEAQEEEQEQEKEEEEQEQEEEQEEEEQEQEQEQEQEPAARMFRKLRLVNFNSNLCDGVYTFSDENQRFEKPNTKQYANADDSRYLTITGNDELECYTLGDIFIGRKTLVDRESNTLGAQEVTFEKA